MPSGIPGITANDAPESGKTPPNRAPLSDGFDKILTAGRFKATNISHGRLDQRTDHDLIEPDHSDQQP